MAYGGDGGNEDDRVAEKHYNSICNRKDLGGMTVFYNF
jgi:hypothetical protein